MATKLDHYLNNINEETKDQVIRILYFEGSEGRDRIAKQVEEFSKLYPSKFGDVIIKGAKE